MKWIFFPAINFWRFHLNLHGMIDFEIKKIIVPFSQQGSKCIKINVAYASGYAQMSIPQGHMPPQPASQLEHV